MKNSPWPIATLIRDLEERGLLDRTLVVIASEFSRDMITEGQPGSTATDQAGSPKDFLQKPEHYGQHGHFTGGSSVVLFGGGMKRGFVYGKTAEERPCVAIKNPVSIIDLHATLFTAMGVSPKTVYDIENRMPAGSIEARSSRRRVPDPLTGRLLKNRPAACPPLAGGRSEP